MKLVLGISSFLVFLKLSSSSILSSAEITNTSGEKGVTQNSFEIPRSCRSKTLSEVDCNKVDISCMRCSYNESCIYGNITRGNCSIPSAEVSCKGAREFFVDLPCVYCFQLSSNKYLCGERALCEATSSRQEKLVVNCTAHAHQHCLGRRKFQKAFPCNWTSGYRWSTSLLLSITLGGFGVDRFYLGHWEEGLGKLFSFGGLGVWTLVDIVLIGVGYITPADGSLYIF